MTAPAAVADRVTGGRGEWRGSCGPSGGWRVASSRVRKQQQRTLPLHIPTMGRDGRMTGYRLSDGVADSGVTELPVTWRRDMIAFRAGRS